MSRASSVHPEGVTYTPHEGSSQPPGTGHQTGNVFSMFCYFGSLHQKLRVGGPPTGSVHRDGSFFLCIVTGASVCCERCTSSLATLRRHFLRAVAAAVFSPCRCGDFGFVSRHKPAEHRIPDVSRTPDVEASCITSCCGRRVLSLKDVAASQYVCSRGADNLSSFFSSFGSDLSSTCFGWCYGRCRLH